MSQNMRDVVWWMCYDGPWLIPLNKSYIFLYTLMNIIRLICCHIHVPPPPMATLASTNGLDTLMIINEEDVTVIGYYLIPHNSQVCFTKESHINDITTMQLLDANAYAIMYQEFVHRHVWKY